ncbi:ABC transporter ATP-binding protein [Candidatus Uabimicrobium sp. HlEnr_7]|uniref:ABC transporter ATP-binding protein n=1 Tax=Candidatus Uabimicrobium helgolandensis TaxID=3095367 RepID=UPI0035584173
MQYNKITNTWHKIKEITTKKDRKYIVFLCLFSFFVSIIETVGISLVMPFVAVAQYPEKFSSNKFVLWLKNTLSIDPTQLVLYLGILLIIFYVLRAFLNMLYYYLLHKFSHDQKHRLSINLFAQYLKMSYKDFTEQNSSILIKNIMTETIYSTQIILHLLYLFSEALTILLIYSILLYLNWKITLLLSTVLLLQILFLVKYISPLVKKMGRQRSSAQKLFSRSLKDSFANFKMLKILSVQEKIVQDVESLSRELSTAYTINNSIGVVPRNFFETIGIVSVITAVICCAYIYGEISSAIATISIFLLSLYRILPALNRILTSYNQILFMYPALETIHNEVSRKTTKESNTQIHFDKQIELKNVCFQYKNSPLILKDISLKIAKNSKVAFVGESGSGKTTLVDIITSLHIPTSGEIYIDDQQLSSQNYSNWRQKIGYIPQDIYLFDGTLAQNIALCSQFQEEKICEVLRQANIFDFFFTREGLSTKVGDGGIKLSGGQKQRVGIARALYNNPEILVLDEATSALDESTEQKIIDEIYAIGKNKTIFIITHRLSTIKNCDIIYKIKDGKVQQKVHS